MSRIVVAVAIALSGAVARAQTTTSATFTTVDAVEAQWGQLVITGVIAGDTVATTVRVPSCSSTDPKCAALLENCERIALLAMTKPGQYLLKVTPGSSYVYSTCKLERVAP